jgi:hypothetical protein
MGEPQGPRALARLGNDPAFALAGESVLLSRVRGERLEVRSLPLAPAGPGRVVFSFRAPPGARPAARLEASSQRVGLIVIALEAQRSRGQPFSGAPPGPWSALAPLRQHVDDRFHPAWHEVDGDTLFTSEVRADVGRVRVVVREGAGEPRTVDLPEGVLQTAFAGDFVAFAVAVPGQPADDEPRRLVVQNWRTRAQTATAVAREGIEHFDVRADGRAVISEDGGGLLALEGSSRWRRLTRDGVAPAFAGDRIVFVDPGSREGDQRLRIVEPGGRVRAFGVPTSRIDQFRTDGARVLWSANGCLLVADVAASAAAEPGPGACVRSELFLDDAGPSPALDRRRRVPLTLRCIAAAPPGCRGTLRLRLADDPSREAARPLRFRIPAGRSQRLAPRLTRLGYRAAIAEARAGLGGAALEVDAVAVDPAGRRSRLRDGYVIEVPRRLW